LVALISVTRATLIDPPFRLPKLSLSREQYTLRGGI
jgi:hypothetical protein